MSSAQDLQAWNDQFGDMDFFPEKSHLKTFDFEYKVAYPCKIKRATCIRSKLGDLQIELQVDVQADEGEGDDVKVLGPSRFWLDLPKQPSDMGKDKALVIKLTQRRYSNLLRILSAAAPARYSLYAERKGRKGAYKFYDFDGELMNGSDFSTRKLDIQDSCVDFVESLVESEDVEILQDALLYIEKRENEKNARYPYVNYYARKPEDVKVYSGDTAPF